MLNNDEADQLGGAVRVALFQWEDGNVNILFIFHTFESQVQQTGYTPFKPC